MADGNTPSGTAESSGALDFDQAVDLHASNIERDQAAQAAKPPALEIGGEETGDYFLDTPSEQPSEEQRQPSDEDEAENEPRQQSQPGPELDLDAVIKIKDVGEIRLQDLVEGNLRQQDYTRKTQEVAQARNWVESRASQVQQFEQQLAQERQFAQSIIALAMPKEPPYNRDDPIGSIEAKEAYKVQMQNWRNLVGQFQQHQQQSQWQSQQEQQQHLAAYKAAELETFYSRFPEFRDQKKAERFISEAVRFGQEVWGLTPQQMDVSEASWAAVLYDATKWRMMQQGKSQADARVAGKPPVPRSVQAPRGRDPQGRYATTQSKQLEDRFRTSGSLEDAADAFVAKFSKRRA